MPQTQANWIVHAIVSDIYKTLQLPMMESFLSPLILGMHKWAMEPLLFFLKADSSKDSSVCSGQNLITFQEFSGQAKQVCIVF